MRYLLIDLLHLAFLSTSDFLDMKKFTGRLGVASDSWL